jgi:hypothetical protein
MAEQKRASGSNAASGGLSIIVASAAAMAVIVTWPIRALLRDGTLAAAWRQGLKELGNTFGQMLPDSNTVQQEPGSVWSPTQGEIAASRNPSKTFYGMDHTIHSPRNRASGIGDVTRNAQTYDPGQSKGKEQGNGLEP